MKNARVKTTVLRMLDIAGVTVIYLLTFSMLLFAGIYINMRQNSAIKTNMPTEKLKALEHSKSGPTTQNDTFCLTPVEYVVSAKKNTGSCFNNGGLMRTLLERNKNIIASLCQNNAEYAKASPDEGKKIWDDAFEHDNFIYIKFANEFLSKIIYDAFKEHFSLASEGGGAENTGEEISASVGETADIYIYELIIIPEKNGECNYYAVSRDKNAGITLIYPNEETSKAYNSETIIAYNNIEGLISCGFLRDFDDFDAYSNIKLPAEAVVFREDTFAEILYTDNSLFFNADNTIDTKMSWIKNFFDFFDFNLEKIKPYVLNGIASYFSPSSGILKFSPGGLIQYNSQSDSEGLNLEKLLYFRSDSYTSADKLAAAFNFADICRDLFVGDKVSLQLNGISFDDENGAVVYTFSYYFNNMLIYGKDKMTDALTVKIKNNIVIEIKFYPMLFYMKEENIKNINQIPAFKHILNGFDSSGGAERTIKSFNLNYFFAETGKKMFPVWTAVDAEEVKGY